MSDKRKVSTDKRKVSTDALETLGNIIDDKQKRDAIHLAVEPVVAGETLYPGQDISVSNGVASSKGELLGIVDPFLKGKVLEGDRFWFVMYPRMVHSLRHVWTHPAFDDEPVKSNFNQKEASEAWLREWCGSHDCPDYDTVIQAITTGSIDAGEYGDYGFRWEDYGDGPSLFFNGWNAHGDIPDEFWDHVEIVTDLKFAKEERATGFSCSC